MAFNCGKLTIKTKSQQVLTWGEGENALQIIGHIPDGETMEPRLLNPEISEIIEGGSGAVFNRKHKTCGRLIDINIAPESYEDDVLYYLFHNQDDPNLNLELDRPLTVKLEGSIDPSRMEGAAPQSVLYQYETVPSISIGDTTYRRVTFYAYPWQDAILEQSFNDIISRAES